MGNFLLAISSSMLVSQSHAESLRVDRERYINDAKSTESCGYIFSVIALLVLIFAVCSGEVVVLVVALATGGIGFSYIHQGSKDRQRGEQCLKYDEIIGDASEISIEKIAAAYPKSVKEVCGDLQVLIDEGLFPEHALDLDQKKIVFSPIIEEQVEEEITPPQVSREESGAATATQTAAAIPTPLSPPPVKELGVIKCPNCGAMNRLFGGREDCEYCDSPLT